MAVARLAKWRFELTWFWVAEVRVEYSVGWVCVAGNRSTLKTTEQSVESYAKDVISFLLTSPERY